MAKTKTPQEVQTAFEALELEEQTELLPLLKKFMDDKKKKAAQELSSIQEMENKIKEK